MSLPFSSECSVAEYLPSETHHTIHPHVRGTQHFLRHFSLGQIRREHAGRIPCIFHTYLNPGKNITYFAYSRLILHTFRVFRTPPRRRRPPPAHLSFYLGGICPFPHILTIYSVGHLGLFLATGQLFSFWSHFRPSLAIFTIQAAFGHLLSQPLFSHYFLSSVPVKNSRPTVGLFLWLNWQFIFLHKNILNGQKRPEIASIGLKCHKTTHPGRKWSVKK